MHTLKHTKWAIFLLGASTHYLYMYCHISYRLIGLLFINELGRDHAHAFYRAGQFRRYFQGRYFWLSVKNNIIIMFTGIAGQIPLGLLLALLLNRGLKGSSFFRPSDSCRSSFHRSWYP